MRQKLIVGLGNPGSSFKATPHNLGFQFVDTLRKRWQSPKFQFQSTLQAEISVLTKKEVRLILVKPQTFMNKSGLAVSKVKAHFQISLQDLWVIHDDIDIPLGDFKISCNRGAAGHKGVLSIIEFLKSEDFCRLRLGIKPKQTSSINRKSFVLQKLKFSQRILLRRHFPQAITALEEKLFEKEKNS